MGFLPSRTLEKRCHMSFLVMNAVLLAAMREQCNDTFLFALVLSSCAQVLWVLLNYSAA